MWSSIKKLIHSRHDRIVIVEDNEPRYVILSVEEYQELIAKEEQPDVFLKPMDTFQKVNDALQEAQISPEQNHELLVRLENKQESANPRSEEKYRASVGIEDLPL